MRTKSAVVSRGRSSPFSRSRTTTAASVAEPTSSLTSQLQPDLHPRCALSWLDPSVGTVGGALGSGFESDEAIRAAACKREQERRRMLQGDHGEETWNWPLLAQVAAGAWHRRSPLSVATNARAHAALLRTSPRPLTWVQGSSSTTPYEELHDGSVRRKPTGLRGMPTLGAAERALGSRVLTGDTVASNLERRDASRPTVVRPRDKHEAELRFEEFYLPNRVEPLKRCDARHATRRSQGRLDNRGPVVLRRRPRDNGPQAPSRWTHARPAGA